jgi:hypothetical protein
MVKPPQRIRFLLTLSAFQVHLCLADMFPELQPQITGRKYDPSGIEMETDEIEGSRSMQRSVPTETNHRFVIFGYLFYSSREPMA